MRERGRAAEELDPWAPRRPVYGDGAGIVELDLHRAHVWSKPATCWGRCGAASGVATEPDLIADRLTDVSGSRIFWLLLVVASTTFAACGSLPPPGTVQPHQTTSAAPPGDGSTGIDGRVTAGPTCPVEPTDHPCPRSPVHERVDAFDSAEHLAGTATTTETGRYSISLPPGTYTLRVHAGGPFPRCPAIRVTVVADATVTGDIDCDTGIR